MNEKTFPRGNHCWATFLALIAAIGVGLAWPAVAGAQTNWTGTVDSDWNNQGNWDNGVPNANDAFVGAGATIDTSADAPAFHRLNLQNTTGLLTAGHAMTLQRLDDNHATLMGNGTSGNLRIISGGSLTLTGDSSADAFNLHGYSAVSTATVDGGSLTATDPSKRFLIGGPGNQGATFTLNNGAVDIAGEIRLGNSSSRGTINLNGGTFNFGGNVVFAGTTVGIIPKPAAVLNIDGATVRGTGTGKSFRVGSDTISGNHGRVDLMSGSLELGTDATMRFGPGGSNIAPSSSGRFFISGGDFHAPGENAFVEIATFGGSPTGTIFGIPTADHGGLNQSGGTALIEGELRIGHGPPTTTTGGVGVYVHRGGDMTVSNSSGTGLLRVAIRSDLIIAGGTITADQFQIDAGTSASATPGELNGRNGTLVGPVNLAGILSPGTVANSVQNNLPGTLNIHGDLTLASTAETFFDFKDPSLAAGTFDVILNDDADNVAFDGALTLRFFGGEYQPGTVAIFDNFAAYSGDFAILNVTGLTNGETATFNPANGTVTVVPELALLVVAGLFLWKRSSTGNRC